MNMWDVTPTVWILSNIYDFKHQGFFQTWAIKHTVDLSIKHGNQPCLF